MANVEGRQLRYLNVMTLVTTIHSSTGKVGSVQLLNVTHIRKSSLESSL